MGIAERKEKQKAEIRQQILDASMKLFTEQGFEHVSMRRIAELIEYSPTTLYLYFKDKNEIFYSLHEMGFAKLNEINRNLAAIKNPLLRLHKMGENYVDFGMQNPEFYDVMFIMRAPMEVLEHRDEACGWDQGDAALNALKSVLQECMDKGFIVKGSVEASAMAIWGMVHGLVSLAIRDRMNHLVPKDQLLNTIHQSLNWFLGAVDTSMERD